MDIYSIRKAFIGVQLVVFFLAILYEYALADKHDYVIILLYSIWNSISYFWLFFKELKYAPDFHPFQVLSLIAVQFIGLNGISAFLTLSRGESIYFGTSKVDDAMYLGIIYLSLQHIILFAVFFYMESRYIDTHESDLKLANKIKYSSIDYRKWAIRFYMFVWLMRALSYVIPLAAVSSVLVNIAKGGHIVTLFLLTFAMIQNEWSSKIKVYHWTIVLVEILLVLNHGMKEEIIRTLVPYCVYVLIMYKGGYDILDNKTKLSLVSIASFIILFVFPFVSIFRTLSNTTHRSWNEISTVEALSEYQKYINNEGMYALDDENRGFGYMMSRAGSIVCNAFSIDYAKKKGTVPQYFYYCCSAVIPRILWPDKPVVVTGKMAYNLARGDTHWLSSEVDEDQCSVSLGFIGSCYLSLGLLGAIIAVVFHSYFIWYLWNFHKDMIMYNIVSLWAFSSMLFVFLKDFESFQDCGINFLAFNLLYLFVCSKIYKGSVYTIEK